MLVHLPVHASWPNQNEIYFSILARKALTPCHFDSLQQLAEVQYCCLAAPSRAGFSPDRVQSIRKKWQERVADLAELLDRRRAAGKVRHSHGDLHLRNICLFDGKPTLFDCLEFDEALATTDVLYDLAFLLMDLQHRGLGHFANRVFNRYVRLDTNDDPRS